MTFYKAEETRLVTIKTPIYHEPDMAAVKLKYDEMIFNVAVKLLNKQQTNSKISTHYICFLVHFVLTNL